MRGGNHQNPPLPSFKEAGRFSFSEILLPLHLRKLGGSVFPKSCSPFPASEGGWGVRFFNLRNSQI
ncbi:MAG TPA: hypothetical protein DEG17_02020 [Cyanobacteria bacterium UBA11149]|nr:hypothetical protein [Cyanobacteria bacterium UBA11367]HBR73696.1 hypothetical protein [Cyanobacteria bacterium UBA11159]HBS69663.1 hypothetical protein [Cyanobacteria bacterium UBA11153]HBW87685.1 hypothetical protein [Cyanobacteria bacterium UBA11149]HCA94395.1 hypothetical protein [Cyanobacteria bacterium UBA9226]